MSALLALVTNGFRESRRNRITVVVFLFAFVMILSATVALELTVVTFERVLTDLGLGVMGLISVFLSIFLATSLVPREIERRTIYMVVSKPVSRSMFIVGRVLGNLLTIGFVLAIMGALFIAQMFVQSAPPGAPVFVAMYGMCLEVLVLTCVGFACSASSSQFVSATVTIGLYFIGHLATDLYRYAERSKSALMGAVGKALYYLIPNLERFDWKARATYAEPTSLGELASATVYGVGYSLVLLVIACVLFERRDFK